MLIGVRRVLLFLVLVIMATAVLVGCRILGNDDGGSYVSALTSVRGQVVIPEDAVKNIRAKTAGNGADTLAGHVPIPGAEVWIKELPDVPHQTTKDDGSYEFLNIPAGEYHVVASYTLPGLNKVYKMLSGAGVPGNSGIQMPRIPLKPATKIVTGILRGANGELLSGTELILWGQKFTVGPDGRFTSPPLPDEGFDDEEILFRGNAGLREFGFRVPFISAVAPIFIEISIPSRTSPDVANPQPYLLSKVNGTITNKVGQSGQVDLFAFVENGSPETAALYQYEWDVEGGDPVVVGDNLQPWKSRWTAFARKGVATISVRVTLKSDTKASATAKLPILVGIDRPSDVPNTAPTATLAGTPANPSQVATTDITVGGTGVIAYKYKLDGAAWSAEQPVSTKIQLSGLADGEHTLSVIGKDAFGIWQTQANATTHTWTVRTVLPVAVLTNAPANPSASSKTNITVGGTHVTHYKYKLDGGAWSAETPVATPLALSGLAEGAHTLAVIARDDLGRWQPENAPTTHNWTVSPITNYSFVKVVGNNGVESGRIRYSQGVAVGEDGTVYVADQENYRISKFNSQGAVTGTIDVRVPFNGFAPYSRLTKIAVVSDRIYAAFKDAGVLVIMTTAGEVVGNIKSFNYDGSEYTVNELHAVAVAPDGRVFIAGRFGPTNNSYIFGFAPNTTNTAFARDASSGTNLIKLGFDVGNNRLLYYDSSWGTSELNQSTLKRTLLDSTLTSHGVALGTGIGAFSSKSFIYMMSNDSMKKFTYAPWWEVWEKFTADLGGPDFSISQSRDGALDAQGNLYIVFGDDIAG